MQAPTELTHPEMDQRRGPESCDGFAAPHWKGAPIMKATLTNQPATVPAWISVSRSTDAHVCHEDLKLAKGAGTGQQAAIQFKALEEERGKAQMKAVCSNLMKSKAACDIVILKDRDPDEPPYIRSLLNKLTSRIADFKHDPDMVKVMAAATLRIWEPGAAEEQGQQWHREPLRNHTTTGQAFSCPPTSSYCAADLRKAALPMPRLSEGHTGGFSNEPYDLAAGADANAIRRMINDLMLVQDAGVNVDTDGTGCAPNQQLNPQPTGASVFGSRPGPPCQDHHARPRAHLEAHLAPTTPAAASGKAGPAAFARAPAVLAGTGAVARLPSYLFTHHHQRPDTSHLLDSATAHLHKSATLHSLPPPGDRASPPPHVYPNPITGPHNHHSAPLPFPHTRCDAGGGGGGDHHALYRVGEEHTGWSEDIPSGASNVVNTLDDDIHLQSMLEDDDLDWDDLALGDELAFNSFVELVTGVATAPADGGCQNDASLAAGNGHFHSDALPDPEEPHGSCPVELPSSCPAELHGSCPVEPRGSCSRLGNSLDREYSPYGFVPSDAHPIPANPHSSGNRLGSSPQMAFGAGVSVSVGPHSCDPLPKIRMPRLTSSTRMKRDASFMQMSEMDGELARSPKLGGRSLSRNQSFASGEANGVVAGALPQSGLSVVTHSQPGFECMASDYGSTSGCISPPSADLSAYRSSSVVGCDAGSGDYDEGEDEDEDDNEEPDGGECRQATRQENITIADLQRHYHIPMSKAARMLGIGSTAMKDLCRSFNILRWPYRKLKSLDTLMEPFQGGVESGDPHAQFITRMLLKERSTMMEFPNTEFTKEVVSLRQAHFKIKYKQKKKAPFEMTG